tara:strand:+ start:91 stop:477 length:387 start_codon:yes stop_codon:yes gene_type:complete
MKNHKPREVACGIMYNKNGKILMGLRPLNNRYGGFWEFPGGVLEKYETIEECLKREWIEELNLEINIEKEIYSSIYDDKFICRFFKGTIINEDTLKRNVHSELKFLEKNEIYKLRLFKGDKLILDILD